MAGTNFLTLLILFFYLSHVAFDMLSRSDRDCLYRTMCCGFHGNCVYKWLVQFRSTSLDFIFWSLAVNKRWWYIINLTTLEHLKTDPAVTFVSRLAFWLIRTHVCLWHFILGWGLSYRIIMKRIVVRKTSCITKESGQKLAFTYAEKVTPNVRQILQESKWVDVLSK